MIWSPFVSNPQNCWTAWTLSKTYSCRPSEVYHIHDEVVAFCFDRAVSTFGTALESALEEATRDAKTRAEAQRKATMVLNRWLDIPAQFADPAKMLKG